MYSGMALPSAINERRSKIDANFGTMKGDEEAMDELTPMYVMNQIQQELNRSNAIFASQLTSVVIDAGSLLFSKTRSELSSSSGSGGIGWLKNRCDPIELGMYRVSTVLSMLPKKSENVSAESDRYAVIADVISLLIAIAIETARLTEGKLMYIPDGHCLFLAIYQEGLMTRPYSPRRDLQLIINDPLGCGWRILGKNPFSASTAVRKVSDPRYRVNFWTELATKCVCNAIFRSPSPEQLRANVVSTGQCPSSWPILPGISLRVWTNPLTSQTDLTKTRVSAKGRLTVTLRSTDVLGEVYSPPIGAWLSGHSSTGIDQYNTEYTTEFSLVLGPPGNRVNVEPKFPVHMESNSISQFTRRQIDQRRLATFFSLESEENGGMLTVNAVLPSSTTVDDPRVLVLEKLSLCFSSLMVHKYMWSAVKRHPSWTRLIHMSDGSKGSKSRSLCMDVLEELNGMTLSPIFLYGGFRRDRLSYEIWMIGKSNLGLQAVRILKKSTADGTAKELATPLFSNFSSQECQWQNRATATWSAPGERYIFTPRCLHHTQFSSIHMYDEHGKPPAGFELLLRFTSPPKIKLNDSSENHWGLLEEVEAGQWIELSQRPYESPFLQHPLATAAVTMAITRGVHESCYLLVNGSRKSRIVDLPLQVSSSSSSSSSSSIWSTTSLLRLVERGETSPERPSEISYTKTVCPESFRVRINKGLYPQTGTAIRDPCPSEMELASMLEVDIDDNKGSTSRKYRAGGIEPNPGFFETIMIDVL